MNKYNKGYYKQLCIKMERLLGCCEALKEYGVNADIAFPIKTDIELYNNFIAKETGTSTASGIDRYKAALYLADNTRNLLIDFKSLFECELRQKQEEINKLKEQASDE